MSSLALQTVENSSGRAVKRRPRTRQRPTGWWTRERCRMVLQVWARELGRTPTSTEALRAGAPVSASVVRSLYGSWTAAILDAGLPLPKRGRPTGVGSEPGVGKRRREQRFVEAQAARERRLAARA